MMLPAAVLAVWTIFVASGVHTAESNLSFALGLVVALLIYIRGEADVFRDHT